MMFDIIIVGAGPSGGIAAKTISKEGFSVIVIERKNKVGYPVQCGEAVSHYALESNNIKPSEKWIVKKVKGIKYTIKRGGIDSELFFDNKGYSIDRTLFDQSLINDATDKGCDLLISTQVKSAIRSNSYWNVKTTKGKEYSCKLIIGADGPISTVSKCANLGKNNTLIRGFQYRMKNIDLQEGDWFEFYSSYEFAYKGYAWVFPRNDNTFNIGIITQGSPKEELKKFLNQLSIKYNENNIIEKNAGIIPMNGTLEKLISDGVMLCGDAAGLTNPITKGGIHAALTSGRLAGEIAVKALEKNDFSKETLVTYQNKIKAMPFSDKILVEGVNIMYSLTEKEWRIFGEINQNQSRIKMLKTFVNPKNFSLMKKILKLKKAFMISRRYGW